MRELRQQIGQNIKALRGSRTMNELGDSLGRWLGKKWSRQAVWDAENGRRDFTAAELVALAIELDVTVAQLLESDEALAMPSGKALTPEAVDAMFSPTNADRDRWIVLMREVRGLGKLAAMLRHASMVTDVQRARLEASARGTKMPQPPEGSDLLAVGWQWAFAKADEWAESSPVRLPPIDTTDGKDERS